MSCFFSRFLSLSSCLLQLRNLFYSVVNSDSLFFKVICEWGWVGVCAKVRVWRSKGGHLWGVGSLPSPLVLRRCDLAKRLHLLCCPLPLTPALFVSHSLPFSKVPPPLLHILAAFLPFIFMYLHLSSSSSLIYSFPSPFLFLAILFLNSELSTASRQSLGTSMPL